jgi:hypothetical protein
MHNYLLARAWRASDNIFRLYSPGLAFIACDRDLFLFLTSKIHGQVRIDFKTYLWNYFILT